ncbi:TPA: hypothetical protein ACX6NV_000553 [Photobacterium damselae]
MMVGGLISFGKKSPVIVAKDVSIIAPPEFVPSMFDPNDEDCNILFVMNSGCKFTYRITVYDIDLAKHQELIDKITAYPNKYGCHSDNRSIQKKVRKLVFNEECQKFFDECVSRLKKSPHRKI